MSGVFLPDPFKTPKTKKGETVPPKKRKTSLDKEPVTIARNKPKKVKKEDSSASSDEANASTSKKILPSADDSFQEFQRVCRDVANVDAYTDKTAIVERMLTKGSEGGESLPFSPLNASFLHDAPELGAEYTLEPK